MDPIYLALALTFLGLALLVLEFFIPSGGLIGIVSGLMLLAAVWLVWKAWAKTHPTLLYCYIGSLIVLVPGTVIGTLWLMPRTKFGNKVLLDAPKLEDVTPFVEEQMRLEELIGVIGKTQSMLNPGGMVMVNDKRYHCESPGLILDPGTDVVVTKVEGNRLVVVPPTDDRKTNPALDLTNSGSSKGVSDAGEQSSTDAQTGPGIDVADASDDSNAPLDFDMPQN